jgi:TonB family protein
MNTFKAALVLSLAMHALILGRLPINLISVQNKKIKPVEIRIVTQKMPAKMIISQLEPNPVKVPEYLNDLFDKTSLQKNKNTQIIKPQLIKAEDTAVKTIAIPDTQDEALKKNPAYMDYYRTIREKIRNNAYSYYDSKDTGEVYLNFVILSDGKLEKASLSPESTQNETLTKIALSSIEKAAPFPVFPEELKSYSRLQFNISIHFKNN